MLTMVPAASELVETVIHLVQHGDVPHAGAHAAETAGATEHGCTGVIHVCACHTTPAATPANGMLVLAAFDDVEFLTMARLSSWHGEGAPAPLIRPPIS